jgi:hypothetical protein
MRAPFLREEKAGCSEAAEGGAACKTNYRDARDLDATSRPPTMMRFTVACWHSSPS